jgi:MFS family permease
MRTGSEPKKARHRMSQRQPSRLAEQVVEQRLRATCALDMGGDITHAIQLAVAPVFLLSGLGTILGVLSTRLGRVVDRTRKLLEQRESADAKHRKALDAELHVLVDRRRLVNRAIAAGTVAALLVCVLIAVAFIGSLAEVAVGPVVAGLFVLAMFAFITALVLFLREVITATSHVDFS